MKKIAYLFILLFIFPLAQAKNTVFVSKYDSASGDINTMNYYDVLRNFSNVTIIKDVKVKNNETDWINAYTDADLIFVISLSDEMLKESRNVFCGNLSVVLNKTKGIVFAGNSSIFNNEGDIFGCPYTTYFNLASAMTNNDLKNNSIKITMAHQITNGYTVNKTYNIKINDSIYALVYPKNGVTLGTVYGGSSQLSPAEYPFLIVWEGISNRISVWAINTSELADCSDCLGWNLFNQLLNWVSNTSDIGFKITTDKEVYYPNERIQINVNSPIDIGTITGTIYYPNNENHSLSFTGSGNGRSTVYLLGQNDPSGNYTIEVLADGIKKSKKVSVNAFYLNLDIDNQTANVNLRINTTDSSGNIVNVNLTVNITPPNGGKTNYYFENNGSVLIIYSALESGEYTVNAKANDAYGRSDSRTKSFSVFLKANIKLTPVNITEVVNKAINLTETITIFNNDTNNVTNIQIEKLGDIKNWIVLTNTSLGGMRSNESKSLTFEIDVPDVNEGNYTGGLKFIVDGTTYTFPITIKMLNSGILSVDPKSWEGWVIKGQSKTIQFFLLNSGKGEVIMKSTAITGDLQDKINIVQEPDKVEAGGNKSLKINIKTSEISMEGLTEKFNSQLMITTDQGIYYPLISLRINVVEDIGGKADDLLSILEGLDNNITTLKKSINVSSLEEKSTKIKADLDQVKSSFDQGDYENAATQYESVELDVETLSSDIGNAYIGIKERKPDYTIIVILIVVVAVVGVIVFVYMRIQSEKKYNWLYQKWKSRVRR